MIKLPYIFIIDFLYLVLCYNTYYNKEIELITLLNNNCNTSIINDFSDEINNELIIRPDFKLFINFLKSNYNNAEIFIYLRDDDEMISIYPEIEKYIDKYENINKLKLKSLNNYDIIVDNLKVKYPSLNKNKKKVFDTQLSIFTTNDNLDLKKINKAIKCPQYNYEYYYDIYDKIINKYNINPSVFDNKHILTFCENNKIPIHNKNGSIYQQDLLYQNILKLYYYKEYQLSDNSIKEDTFFKDYINKNQMKMKIK
jgi:hypothetical protein